MCVYISVKNVYVIITSRGMLFSDNIYKAWLPTPTHLYSFAMETISAYFQKSFTLNNGNTIPAVGLGTYQGDAGNSAVKDTVLAALKKGYRHIDCATAYDNEAEVGQAIQESGIPRAELYITTKLSV